MPRSDIHLKVSRNSHVLKMAIFAKWSGTWLSRGGFWVSVVNTGSAWLLGVIRGAYCKVRPTCAPRNSHVDLVIAAESPITNHFREMEWDVASSW